MLGGGLNLVSWDLGHAEAQRTGGAVVWELGLVTLELSGCAVPVAPAASQTPPLASRMDGLLQLTPSLIPIREANQMETTLPCPVREPSVEPVSTVAVGSGTWLTYQREPDW